MKLALLSTLLWAFQLVAAKRELIATALVPCAGTNGVTAKSLSVLYNHLTRTVYYNATVNVNFSGYVYADIDLYIYGLKAIHTRLDPCGGNTPFKQLCPVTSGQIDIESNSVLSHSITKHIPGVAFTVPDIDAYMIAKIRDNTSGDMKACVRIEISNSNTVEQTSVKWVTACLGGLGFFVSTLFVFLGTSLDSQSISAVTVLMLQYYQSVAMTDMQAVERVPPIASAWSENIAWSVGIIYTRFLEKIVRWYIQSTGGTPKTLRLFRTEPVLLQRMRKRALEFFGYAESMSNQNPRGTEWLEGTIKGYFSPGQSFSNSSSLVSLLAKRKDNEAAQDAYATSSDSLIVYRGIDRLAFKQGLEVTSTVLTTYILFIFICVCVVFLFAVLYLIVRLATRKSRHQQLDTLNEKADAVIESPFTSIEEATSAAAELSSNHGVLSRSAFFYMLLPSLLKGTLLKLWYVAFPSIMVFSMWEWTRIDSAAVVVISVFMFVICLVLVLFNVIRLFFIVKKSTRETGSPSYMLYADPKILQKFGYLYSMFDIKYYWFGFVYLCYNFVKALFLAFAQSSGKTQALAIFIIELAMFIVVCVFRPFLSSAVNGIQITSHVVVTFNACFFLFFSNLMTQPLIVNGVMGVIFFVLNAAFSLFLLLYIIIYSSWCLILHQRNGTRADHRPKDDRNSYIVDRTGQAYAGNEELQALGQAAKADHASQDIRSSPSWFNTKESLYSHESSSQNPFEPQTVPPNTQFSRERASLSGSRTNTMSSESAFGEASDLGPFNNHRNTESTSSFGLNGDSSNNNLIADTSNTKSKKKGFFKRR